MSRRLQENAIAACLLLFFVTIFVMSFDYGPRARLVPLPLAALGIILTLVQIAWQNLRSLDDLEVDMLELISGEKPGGPRAAALEPGAHDATQPAEARGWERLVNKEAAAFGIVAILLALFLVVGPLPAIFVFLAAYLAFSRVCAWPKALVYGGLGTAAVYLLFGRVLSVQFNRGLLSPFFAEYLHF